MWLAADPPSGEAVKAGPIGILVIVVLCVVCYFLFRSMSKHLRKVREQFPGELSPPVQPPDPVTAGPVEPAGPSAEASDSDATTP